MKWDCEAIEKLKKYEKMKAALENIQAEIHRLELERTSIRSAMADGAPVRGGGNRREDRLLTNIVMREELDRQLARTREWVEMTDRGLACLDDEERLVLDRIYIHGHRGAVSQLMEELGLEKSQIYVRKENAIRHFTIALYGGVES